ncbi:MAG: MFS transporter [Saccharofermentanales bacterium]
MNKIRSQIEDRLRQSTHMHWIIVAAVMFTLVAMWGATYNSYSLFVTPVQESLQVSRSDIVLGVTVKGIGSILGSYLCALLLNKIPVMKLLRLCALLLVGNIVSLSFVQNLWQYYAVLFIQAVLTVVGGFIPLSIIIHNWFEKRSALAIGLAFTGTGLGGAIFNWLGGIWIPSMGWRRTMFLFGIINLFVFLITLFLIIRATPYELGLRPYGASDHSDITEAVGEMQGIEVREAFRSVRFWVFMSAVFLMGIATNSLFNNISPHLIDTGYSLSLAAKITSALMLFLMIGKALIGYLFDLLGLRRGALLCTLSISLGIFSAIMINNRIFILTLVVGAGIGLSFNSIAYPVFSLHLFGPKNYARFSSFLQIAHGFATILNPIIVSIIFQRSHSYVPAFWIFFIISCLVAITWLFVLPSQNKEPF